MPAGFGERLWELPWWSLNVLLQQRQSDKQANTPNSKISHVYEKQSNSGSSDGKRIQQAYVWFLRDLGVLATVSTHSLIRRQRWCTKESTSGCWGFPLSVSPSRRSHSAAAARSRLTAAGASRCSCTTRPPVETKRPWCALMRSPSLARTHPSRPKRARAWLDM